jgi:8-oxo-dGTP pyrophosphatase MutT (NUDIX family)
MELIHFFKERLSQGALPGEEAQLKMAHAFRRKLWPAGPDARLAGVMMLLYPKDNQWQTVIIQRASKNPNDVHSGQLSFPGGKKEDVDLNMMECALRETQEEIGVGAIEVIGGLTPLFIPVSNFLVYPFMGYISHEPNFNPDIREVQDVLTVPLHHFQNEAHIKQASIHVGSGMELNDVPYYDIHGRMLWGATAMIISEVTTILEESFKEVSNFF